MMSDEKNWEWARRIESKQRVAEAALRKEEAEAMKALDKSDELKPGESGENRKLQ